MSKRFRLIVVIEDDADEMQQVVGRVSQAVKSGVSPFLGPGHATMIVRATEIKDGFEVT